VVGGGGGSGSGDLWWVLSWQEDQRVGVVIGECEWARSLPCIANKLTMGRARSLVACNRPPAVKRRLLGGPMNGFQQRAIDFVARAGQQ
jgi:hypothetical protein